MSIFAAAARIFGTADMPRLLQGGSTAAVVLYVAASWVDIGESRHAPSAGSHAKPYPAGDWVTRYRSEPSTSTDQISVTFSSSLPRANSSWLLSGDHFGPSENKPSLGDVSWGS
jgi:hypothetical protein